MTLHYKRAMETISLSSECRGKILAQKTNSPRKQPFRRWAALAAVLACALVITTNARAIGTALYTMAPSLFHNIAPSIAQSLREVQLSDTSQGITMEVQSAFVEDGVLTAYILLSDDQDGSQLSQGVDFYHSFHVDTPYQASEVISGYQSLGYDEESRTYGFLVTIRAKDIMGKKISFEEKNFTLSVRQLMLGQNKSAPTTTPDWSALPVEPATVKASEICGWSYVDNYCHQVRLSDGTAMVLQPGSCDLPTADGYTVTAMGFLDNGLHIQMRCDELGADDYGSLFLVKPDGEKFSRGSDMCSVSFRDGNGVKYDEFIYNIAPDNLDGCTLEGEFTTGGRLLDGDWEVTFHLDG